MQARMQWKLVVVYREAHNRKRQQLIIGQVGTGLLNLLSSYIHCIEGSSVSDVTQIITDNTQQKSTDHPKDNEAPPLEVNSISPSRKHQRRDAASKAS